MPYSNMHFLVFFINLMIPKIVGAQGFLDTSLQEIAQNKLIDLCYICDRSLKTTFDRFTNISASNYNLQGILLDNKRRACWEHGVHNVFCLPTPKNLTEKKSKELENDREEECKTFLSILPPPIEKDSCNVNIFDNNGKLEDILTIKKNGNIESTNNSWYTMPKSETTNLKYTIIKTIPSKKSFEDTGEGAYTFQFAENYTIQQFLYSRTIFLEKNLHFWWSNLNRNDLNKTYLQRSKEQENFVIQINDDFKGCLDYYKYNITLKHHKNESMHEHVNCNIVNGENEICNWRWIEDQDQFNISLTNIELTQTLHGHQSYDAGKYDVLGYIRCRIKDEAHFRDINFDLPFVVRHPNSSSHDAFSEARSNYTNPTLLLNWGICLSTIVLILLFASIITFWNYTRRKKRISNTKKRLERFRNGSTSGNQCIYLNHFSSSSSSHNSFCSSRICIHTILPRWMLEKPELVCPPDSIQKGELIGSGQYGMVYKGSYIHGTARFSVAIKSSKSISSTKILKSKSPYHIDGENKIDKSDVMIDPDIDLLMDEAKTMFSIDGYHENIVNLQGIGYEADFINGTLDQFSILLEYCSQGNVLSYVQNHAAEFKNSISKHHGSKQSGENSHVIKGNGMMDFSSLGEPWPGANIHSSSLLVIWSYQVANGMEFLSDKNIYHGDLAARNILLNEHLVAKVADFGLSRRLYEDFSINSIFKENQTSMKIPTKWLALETLAHGQIIPGRSDVWSFGVVMWEIFSLGLTPYRPHIDFNTLRIELESGIRLTQPIGCPANIWSMMMSCWRSDPNARPSFGQLKISLYKDHHFPKVLETPENDNLDDHVRKKYKVILEDSSMRTKYKDICQQNIDYLSIHCNNSSIKTATPTLEMGAVGNETGSNSGNTRGPAESSSEGGLKSPGPLQKPICLSDLNTGITNFQGHTRAIDLTSLRSTYETPLINSKLSNKYTNNIQTNENGDMLESGMNAKSEIRGHKKYEDNGNEDSYKSLGSEGGVSQSTQYTAIDISETMAFMETKYQQKEEKCIGRMQSLHEVTGL